MSGRVRKARQYVVSMLPALLLGIAPNSGCTKTHANAVPIGLASSERDLVHTAQASQVTRPTVESLAAHFHALNARQAPQYPRNILVLSGGGQYASYNAGILVGWSKSGTRPNFDVVTGISSGAIVACYAFLGSKYDQPLQQFFTTIRDKDLFVYRPVVELIRHGSLANPRRLERLIESQVTDSFMHDLRAAHEAGRRLYVGTANISTRRLVVWDVGAVACSQRPDAAALVSKIILASVSIPGLLPPVKFSVEIQGKLIEEEHADGGTVSQAFLRYGPGMQKPPSVENGWLKGSNLYAMAAGKFYADPISGRAGFLKKLTSNFSAALYALYRAELMAMYAACLSSGMSFNAIAIPQDAEAPKNSTTFQPKEMIKLFQLGYEEACQGIRWRHTPPGAEPGEEELPRETLPIYAAPWTLCPAIHPGLARNHLSNSPWPISTVPGMFGRAELVGDPQPLPPTPPPLLLGPSRP